MLACIAFSCPNLDSLEILTSDTSVNRITGYALDLILTVYLINCLFDLNVELII